MEKYKSNNPESVSLWARVGVSINVTRAVYDELLKGSPELMKDILTGKVGTVMVDGETYFPDIPQNRALGEMGFDISADGPIGGRTAQPDVPLNIKVLVDSGVVNTVLKDKNVPVDVEVIDVDTDYIDYEQLREYEKKVRDDPSFMECHYSVANFDPGLEEPESREVTEGAPQNDAANPELSDNVSYMEVVAYLKAQGYPNPSQIEIEDWLQADERQAQRNETIRNKYDLCDMDRWFHLEDILGMDMTFNTAMSIDCALWEEDIETLELSEPGEIFNTPEGVCRRRLLASLGRGELDPEADNACRLVKDDADLRRLALFFIEPQKAQDRGILDFFDRGRFTDTTNVVVCADTIDKQKVVCVDLCYNAKSEPCDVVNLTTLPATDKNIQESKGFAFKLSNLHKIPWHSEVDKGPAAPAFDAIIASAKSRAQSVPQPQKSTELEK